MLMMLIITSLSVSISREGIWEEGKISILPRWCHGKESACQCRRCRRCAFPGSGRSLEEGIATPSSILAWRTPWTEEPVGLQSTGSQLVRPDRPIIKQEHKKVNIQSHDFPEDPKLLNGRAGRAWKKATQHQTQALSSFMSPFLKKLGRHFPVWAYERELLSWEFNSYTGVKATAFKDINYLWICTGRLCPLCGVGSLC